MKTFDLNTQDGIASWFSALPQAGDWPTRKAMMVVASVVEQRALLAFVFAEILSEVIPVLEGLKKEGKLPEEGIAVLGKIDSVFGNDAEEVKAEAVSEAEAK